jgi:hypothetical protein
VTETPTKTQDEIPSNVIMDAYKQMFTSLFLGTLITLVVAFICLALFLLQRFIMNDPHPSEPPLIATIMITGALGAFFSALTRLYSFSDLPKVLLDHKFSLPTLQLVMYSVTPSIVGAIAAVVLYLTFAGHIVTGDLFPDIECSESAAKTCTSFSSLFGSYGPALAKDFAKAFVWSFVAGFAERLVPNTLEALSKAVSTPKE